mgnify:CR=1 FL=1
MSFIFYDTETTGLDTTFGQILQFAAVRTDENFQEVDRFEIRSRLMPHVVASPGAMRVTKVSANALSDPAIPSHYQMVSAIRQKLLEWSPAIFIGYNSIGYDEPLLRQAFYQSLYSTYLTNTNGNRRMDALKVVQAASVFAPDVLTIPVNAKGRPIFKLEQCAPANGFDHANAHDALADVLATVHLCRLVAQRAPELWQSLSSLSTKAAATSFIRDNEVFCLTEFYYGRAFPMLVTSIGTGGEGGSSTFVYDLNVDPELLAQETDERLAARLGGSPKVVRSIRLNSAPVLLSADHAPQDLDSARLGMHELSTRARRLKGDPQLCERLIAAVEASWDEREPPVHVEERIYEGFPSREDEQRLSKFHSLPWEGRMPLLREIEDERLRQLGQRIIYMEAPHVLSDEVRSRIDAEIARRVMGVGHDPKWLTIPVAIDEADELLSEAETTDEVTLLTEHKERLILMQNAVLAMLSAQS